MPKVDASIAFSATDNLSQSIVGMRNSLNTMKSDAQGLQKQLDALDNTRLRLKNVDLKQAKQQLDEASRALRELGESASEADRQTAQAKFDAAQETYSNLEHQLSLVSRQARQTQKDLLDATGAVSRLDNRASRSTGGARLNTVDALIAGGIGDMAADAAMELANTYVSSAYGQSVGGIVSSTLSGAASGAAIGTMINPGLGTAVGGLVGGAVGAVTGGSQVYASRDEAFKSYVQEAAEGQLSAQEEAISSGSATAAQRELDAIAFNQLLGSGAGGQYLEQLRALAAETPFEYSDLTSMSRALATGFGGTPERMLDLMTAIGDAGSAVGLTASDMEEMARSMSRMQSSGKATLEYLNIFQDRGVDVIGMLSEAMGLTQGEVYDKISKGEINGQDAVDILFAGMQEAYAGSMDQMSQTFSGLTSTLEDAEAELNNAYGEGYNAARKEGLQEQIDWLDSGAMEEANRAIGAWQAELENERERYEREAVDAVMASEEYRTAEAEGNAAEMGRLIMQAKVDGMNQFNASEGAQLALESELALAEGIRKNTQTNDAYWDAGYRKGEQYSKGLAEGILSNPVIASLAGLGESRSGASSGGGATYTVDDVIGGARSLLEHLEEFGSSRSSAYGLRRVPYDGYAAILHEGERVLTAREARAMDRGGPGGVTVNVTGSWSVRSGADVDALAEALYRRIRTAQMGGVRT